MPGALSPLGVSSQLGLHLDMQPLDHFEITDLQRALPFATCERPDEVRFP